MAHKGYTLNYFINFFESTKPSEWICGVEADGKPGKEKHCAIGFAGGWHAVSYDDDDENFYYEPTTPEREAALTGFVNGIVEINDSNHKKDFYYKKLGKHPRTRVIKALKLRKKHGPNWEETL